MNTRLDKIRLYPRGFLFCDFETTNLPSHFEYMRINDFYYYYEITSDKLIHFHEDKFLIIHGHHYFYNFNSVEYENLAEYLLSLFYKNSYESFLDNLGYMAGRYVIIVGDSDKVYLYSDTANTRSSYLSLSHNLFASHVGLILDVKDHELDERTQAIPGIAIHWHYTPYKDIVSSIPNNVLELFSKERNRYFPYKNNPYTELSHESKLEYTSKVMKSLVNSYMNRNYKIISSLTAGKDSRFLASMLREYKDKVQYFTYTKRVENPDSFYSRVLSRDGAITKQIVDDLNFIHQFIYLEDKIERLTKTEISILKRNSYIQHGRFLLKHYHELFQDGNYLHLRGTLLETVRGYYIKNKRSNKLINVEKVFRNAIKKDTDKISKQSLTEVINDGIKAFSYDKELWDYHKLDLFYWEDRMGRWHSEILNEIDVAYDTLALFNMRCLFEIGLSYPLNKRKENYFINEMINLNYPVLNFYSKNREPNLYELSLQKNFSGIIDKITVYDADLNKTTIPSEDMLFIPEDYIAKNVIAETSYIFQNSEGYLSISYLSKYYNNSAKNYFKLHAYVNDELIMKDDLSAWVFNVDLNIFNLKRGDIVSFKVVCCRNLRGRGWETATRVTFSRIEERKSTKINDYNLTFNNPYIETFEKL